MQSADLTPATDYLDPGTRLPLRLFRSMPWGFERGGRLLLALFLIGFSGALLIPIINHWGEKDIVMPAAVVSCFGLVGLLLLYASLHQALAKRSPETMVEVEHFPFQAGEKMRACIIQPGPVKLSSLRANLVCLESGRTGQGRRRRRRSPSHHLLYQHNVLDLQDVVVRSGETFEQMVTLEIPAEARKSGREQGVEITWRIEVWGKVKNWPGFMHPFTIWVQ